MLQGTHRWILETSSEIWWGNDEGFVNKPGTIRRLSSKGIRQWRYRSLLKGKLLPEMSTTRPNLRSFPTFRPGRNDNSPPGSECSRTSSPTKRWLDHRQTSSSCVYCQYWRSNTGTISFSLLCTINIHLSEPKGFFLGQFVKEYMIAHGGVAICNHIVICTSWSFTLCSY